VAERDPLLCSILRWGHEFWLCHVPRRRSWWSAVTSLIGPPVSVNITGQPLAESIARCCPATLRMAPSWLVTSCDCEDGGIWHHLLQNELDYLDPGSLPKFGLLGQWCDDGMLPPHITDTVCGSCNDSWLSMFTLHPCCCSLQHLLLNLFTKHLATCAVLCRYGHGEHSSWSVWGSSWKGPSAAKS
jgi:hypothetical protein